MFGFGKKKIASEKEAPKQKKTKQGSAVVSAAQLPAEKFTVMPQQYLPKNNKASKGIVINKKLFILVGGSILVLSLLGVVLYIVLFSGNKTQDSSARLHTPTAAPQKAPAETAEPQADLGQEEQQPKEKIVSSEAYDELNQLAGALTMTIPAQVAEKYGDGMGITVLKKQDIGLQEDVVSMGGIYSLYPVAITFEEPVSIEFSVASMPSGVEKKDIYPAYLRGVNWHEIEDYQVSLAGFSFMMEKFPTGPITAILRPDVASSTEQTFDIKPMVPSQDTDLDGLTDKEEELFGTSNSSVDSDEDTYPDKDEIFNGYSPTLGAGVKLSEGELFSVYTNPTYGYKIAYPTQWLADSLDQTNKQVLFISDTEEFFEILIEENPLNIPIADWYRGQSPSLKNIELDIAILDSRPAVWSPDKTTLYTSKDGLVYVLTYNKGTLEEINWPSVFEYFYKSFKFGNISNDSGAQEEGASSAKGDSGNSADAQDAE